MQIAAHGLTDFGHGDGCCCCSCMVLVDDDAFGSVSRVCNCAHQSLCGNGGRRFGGFAELHGCGQVDYDDRKLCIAFCAANLRALSPTLTEP